MIDILFQNKNFIVAVKPAGISSQSDNCGGEDMTALLKKQTGSDIFPVHRLDKVTGGVMLYAKNSAAAAKFAKITADGCFIKRYFAVVAGKPEKSAARLEDFLIFDKYSGKSAIVESSVKGAKKAGIFRRCRIFPPRCAPFHRADASDSRTALAYWLPDSRRRKIRKQNKSAARALVIRGGFSRFGKRAYFPCESAGNLPVEHI